MTEKPSSQRSRHRHDKEESTTGITASKEEEAVVSLPYGACGTVDDTVSLTLPRRRRSAEAPLAV